MTLTIGSIYILRFHIRPLLMPDHIFIAVLAIVSARVSLSSVGLLWFWVIIFAHQACRPLVFILYAHPRVYELFQLLVGSRPMMLTQYTDQQIRHIHSQPMPFVAVKSVWVASVLLQTNTDQGSR